MKRLLCKLFGHQLTLDIRKIPFGRIWRLRCVRCGANDPYTDCL